jgi:hypothetical protein
VIDFYGYVSVDTNRYSVPERLVGWAVSVHKHPAEIVIYRRDDDIARNRRLIGQRHTLPGHHPKPTREDRGPVLEEQLLPGNPRRSTFSAVEMASFGADNGLRHGRIVPAVAAGLGRQCVHHR